MFNEENLSQGPENNTDQIFYISDLNTKIKEILKQGNNTHYIILKK